jgi:hypothetical protein
MKRCDRVAHQRDQVRRQMSEPAPAEFVEQRESDVLSEIRRARNRQLDGAVLGQHRLGEVPLR